MIGKAFSEFLSSVVRYRFITHTRTLTNSKSVAPNTIFALSSGHGRCGVAVIRVSGPSSADTVKSLCCVETLPRPRHAVLQRLFDPATRDTIDRGLVLWFPGPRSFTGEDCAEFQVHGGTAVVAAMLEALGTVPGLRPAEPGDFTKRAFLNGKMDLTEVEGLGDLIHAETAAQRRQAVRQMEGDLGNLYADWRRRVLKCLANVEAYIDFSEDENIEEDAVDNATAEIKTLCKELHNHLSDSRRGERLRDGVRVAIIGEPNVGKSSLLNALCQRPAAIVSPMAGTTRDVVETGVNLAGYPVLLSDTAGLRDTGDIVEKEGVRRALDRASQADVKVLVLDASTVLPAKPSNTSWSHFIYTHMKSLGLHQDSPAYTQDTDQLCAESLDQPTVITSSVNEISGEQTISVPDNPSLLISETAMQVSNSEVNLSDDHEAPGCHTAEVIRAPVTARTSHFQTSDLDVVINKTMSINVNSKPLNSMNNKSVSSVVDNVPVCNTDISIGQDVLVAVNKSDLLSAEETSALPTSEELGVDVCSLSCATAQGLDSFITMLADRVKRLCGDPLAGSPSLTQARHRTHLTRCQHHLKAYLLQVEQGDIVLAAQALRRAMRELGSVTGAVNVEEVLDVIFKDFCIGK